MEDPLAQLAAINNRPINRDWQSAFAHFNQAQQPAKKKGGRGGFLTSLISEGGALGGAAAGATIGSAVPVLGTAIGGIIGAGLGAFGGRLAENQVRDSRFGVGDAAKEGALSAVLAGPLKLGKYGMSAGKGMMAGQGLEKALVAGADDAAKFSVKGVLGKSLTNKADDLAIKSFRFTPSQLTNFTKRYGEDASQVISRNNLIGKTADDFEKAVAGHQQSFDQLVNTAGTIKKSEVEKTLATAYGKLLKSAPSDTKKMGIHVKGEVDGLLSTFGDEISAPELNAVRRQFDDLVTYTNKAADPARYGVNKRIADSLRKTIQKASGSDELKNSGMEISKLRQLGENVAMQANRGRGSNPLSITAMMAGAGGGTAMGLPGAVIGYTAAKTLNSPTVLKGAAKGFEGLGSKLTAKAANSSPIRDAIMGAGRGQFGEGIFSGAEGLEAQSQSVNSMQNSPNNPANTATPISSNIMGQGYNTPDDLSSINSIPGAPKQMYSLENAIMDMQRDPKNQDYYMKLYSFANPEPKKGKGLNSTQQQQANNSMSGLQDIQSIRETLQKNPNATKMNSLPGGGFTRSLTGTTDYDASRRNVADIIGRLRSGGAINADEQKNFLALLPGTFDSPQSAEAKLGRLESLFAQFASPQQGSDSLEDALMSYQGGYN